MIYVASSWRNNLQQYVVLALRKAGHQVYDFRNPKGGDKGFHWSDIDPKWKEWSPQELIECLRSPVASLGFQLDWNAMKKCDICVLVMPCGRSAHLEAGWFLGANKPTCILLSDGEPELMYKMANKLVTTIGETILFCDEHRKQH